MEKKFFIIILFLLLVFLGKIFGKRIFEPSKLSGYEKNKAVNSMNVGVNQENNKEEDVNVDTDNNTEQTNKTSVDKESTYSTKHYDYMDLYPDLYVREVSCEESENEQFILDVRMDSLEYSKDTTCEQKKEKENEDNENGEQQEKKVAYLTFDDGPSDNTKKVLEILKKHNIKATFFMIADTVTPDRYDLLNQMIDEGHVIGIHTYTHNYRKIYSSIKAYLEDFNLAYLRIKEVTGVAPTIYRFPGGSNNCFIKGMRKQLIEEMERRGFTYYDWHVSAEDSVGNPSKASILRNVKRNYNRYNTPIILMHDSSINELTVDTLEDIIRLYEEDGYVFDTVNHRVKKVVNK